MDEEIVITRAGGACEMTEQGIRQQAKSQTYKSAHIATFEKNMRENIPIGIIFGKLSYMYPSLRCTEYHLL